MIVILSWMRDLPVDLYPGAPPSVQIRGKPATDPLNRGISQHHLHELCKLGEEVQGLMELHPSDWTFGSWDEAGFIMLVPALLKDDEQVANRQISRIV
jgi:hypothetical protein